MSTSPGLRLRYIPFAAVFAPGLLGCVIQSPAITAVDIEKPPAVVRSPVKAHLSDGSTVVYPAGVTLVNQTVTGVGIRYFLGSATGVSSSSVPLDSIVGMEAYDRKIDQGGSVAASSVGAVLGVAGGIALLKALFGSCPTFYADSAGTELLQGEGFSYSVAPLLEQRDVDRLRLEPGHDGHVLLKVRNEALETHYINHLEIIETLHEKNETVLPDQTGRPVAVAGLTSPLWIRDRSGRDISAVVRSADQIVFATASARMANVTEADLDDWIDLEIAAPSRDSVAVVMEMRNSLLNTVLLYEQILGAPGIKALDFLGKDLENISGAVEMAKWYSSHMGMRISVLDGGKWRQVARIGDSGPIAFHQFAVMIPAVRNEAGNVSVRLAFVADDWRIDAVKTSLEWRRPAVRRIAPARIAMEDPSQNPVALAAVLDPDESYLITSPGNSFKVEFDAGLRPGVSRTFMLASQGYYTEWVRGSWIKAASGKPFEPTSAALLEAIKSWRSKQREMERDFYSSRIATR